MIGPSCAISGECPISDGVVIPSSGIICSKRLLLAKIHENGGYDPFSKSGNDTLEESQLISLNTSTENSSMMNIAPPKIPTYNSIPSILSTLQKSHDAILLELFDTRQALNETRRELSDALYQNDAAVRVVARISAERDAAREELGIVSSTTVAVAVAVGGDGTGGGKRRRMEDNGTVDEDVDVGPSLPPAPSTSENDAMDVDTTTNTTTSTTITTEEQDTNNNKNKKLLSIQHIEEMTNKWSALSSARRASKKKNKKKKKGGSDTTTAAVAAADTTTDTTTDVTTDTVIDEELTMETINQEWKNSQNPIRKLNLHRSNASPGILSLSSSSSSSSKNRYLASLGKDRHIVIYDCHLQKVNCRTKKMMVSNAVVDRNNQVFLHVYTNATAAAAASDVAADTDILKCIVAEMNGNITLLSADNSVLKILSTISILDEKEDDNDTIIDTTTTANKECVVGMMVHPTNNHVLVTTNRGVVHVLYIPPPTTTKTTPLLQEVACFKGDQDTTTNTSKVYNCMGLHPDGLILALGRSDGNVILWDLKTQRFASVLKTVAATTAIEGTNETNMSNNNNEYAIESVAFSENGYHISSIATNGTVTVWDLRKQKVIKTLEEHSLTSNEMASNFALKEEMQKKEANSLPSKKKKKKSSSSESPSSLLLSSLEPPRGLSFCPEGRHLAYGTAKGAIVIASCKEWDRPVVTLNTATTTSSKEEPGSFSVQDMVWIRELLPDDDNDDNKKKRTVQLLASCGGEGERVVKFWGAGSDNEGDRE